MAFTLQNTKSSVFFFKTLSKLPGQLGSIFTKSQPELVKITNLVQRLSELPNVEQVRAIRHKDDCHEITFEILSYADFDSTRQLAEQATRLVHEVEWQLCETTQNNNWDFGTQILRKFSSNVKQDQIVSFSDVKSEY